MLALAWPQAAVTLARRVQRVALASAPAVVLQQAAPALAQVLREQALVLMTGQRVAPAVLAAQRQLPLALAPVPSGVQVQVQVPAGALA